MFHINALHERVLRVTYGDKSSSSNDLLQKNNSVSIHRKNCNIQQQQYIKYSVICLLQFSIFALKGTPYELHKTVLKVNSVYNGTETLSHVETKVWNFVPQEIRHSVSLGVLNEKSKNGVHLIIPADYAKNVYIK